MEVIYGKGYCFDSWGHGYRGCHYGGMLQRKAEWVLRRCHRPIGIKLYYPEAAKASSG